MTAMGPLTQMHEGFLSPGHMCAAQRLAGPQALGGGRGTRCFLWGANSVYFPLRTPRVCLTLTG